MNNLKYLMIYEAFQSDAISKILKHIGSKIKSSGSRKFLDVLKEIVMNVYGFQIDKISDSDVKYMSAKQAKKITTQGEISNPYGIYALKFWFSVDDGYLGFTGVGDEKMKSSAESFNEDELNHIKDSLDIKTGKLIPVLDYRGFKTGDKVLGYYSDYQRKQYLALGTIWREGDQLWVIQDVNDGGSPNDSSWTRYGRSTWNIGEVNYPADDHSKLHSYIESEDELTIVQSETGDLLVNSSGELTKRNNSYSGKYSDVERADFAIVLYIDGLLKDDGTIYDVRKLRDESRKGATALMTPEEIKTTNFQKYMDKIINLYGITLELKEEDLKNLQNLIKSILCDKNIFFSLYLDQPSLDRIETIMTRIESIIKSDDKEYNFARLRDTFRSYREDAVNSNKKYNGSKERVKKHANENVMNTFNRLYELSSKINDYLSKQKINNIDDIEILHYKLEFIRKIIKSSRHSFTTGFENALCNFHYNDSDVERGVVTCNDRNEDMSINLRKIENIEKFLEQTFRN